MPRIVLTEEEGNKALDAAGTDLKYLFSRHEVSVDNQKLFYHHGATTLEKLSNFAKDREDLTAVLKQRWELDSERTLDERVQIAAIVCAFGNAKTRSQRAAEVDAEYDSLQWSRPVVAGEWAAMRSALEKRYGYLEDKIYPAKEYVEKKLAEVESGEYRAEELTEIVSKEESEPETVVPIWDSKGRLAMKKGSTKVQEPANAEELRKRLTVWKNAMVMISLEHSNRHELQGAWEETVEQYKDYLLGDYVYGLSAKDAEGQTFAAPPWKLVIAYEKAIRKQAVKITNTEGKPLTVALKTAWKDATVKERNFTTWTAEALLTSFVKEWSGGGEALLDGNGSRKRRAEEDLGPPKKVRREEVEVDPMNPPFAGGDGPPRACRWKGLDTPFHDGGGLASPGRWHPSKRRRPEGEEWSSLGHGILLEAVRVLGSVNEVEKEAFRMARGGDSFRLVRDEAFLARVRGALATRLNLVVQLEPEPGQPFFLDLLKGVLQRAGDPDYDFLEQAKTGLPLGVLNKLPRTPEIFEEQQKWNLEGEDWGLAVWQKSNYISAEEHERFLVEHLEQEVAEGLMVKMSEEDFIRKFGDNRAVAALAVLVEDEITGKRRVIHDGTHGVMVNHKIRRQDKVRMPGPREKRALLEGYEEERAVVLSLVGDFAKAHRRFKYMEEEQGFLACKASTHSKVVYVNQVGTFGIASTPYWWARLSAALMRAVYWILGEAFPNDMLLYADDLEVLAVGRVGRIGGVLAYATMAAFGAPFKWAKQRGGLVTEWIGLTTDYSAYAMGLSQRRTEWLVGWIASLRERKEVSSREFSAGLGRLGFSALALPWEKPLLGPLYAWAAAIQSNRGTMTIPWAIQFILDWISQRLQSGGRLEEVRKPKETGRAPVRIWTDAKATEQEAWIGGWLEESSCSRECRWFSLKVTEVSAPWLYYRGRNPKRVIAALELLATLVALKLWLREAGDSAEVLAEAFTDNRGNSFILKKGLSTKYPITLLVIEVAETLRRLDAYASLTWVRRDGNVLADALTNEDYSAFDPSRRETVVEGELRWYVMGSLIQRREQLFDEIKRHKEMKREAKTATGQSKRKAKKFFDKWKS
ncbi:unnamed protein product [Durusdinium trenchii]|uniref:Reverse transcriptase domain-containing protein n=1 Tax=Durusdinium trenchii TaxID=1381693 RepID=A0ABP0SFG6_9DINO